MSCQLRHDQACLNGPDCCPEYPNRPRPARHGGLCSPCFLAAAPEVKETCLLLDRIDARVAREERQLAQLDAIWTAPYVEAA